MWKIEKPNWKSIWTEQIEFPKQLVIDPFGKIPELEVKISRKLQSNETLGLVYSSTKKNYTMNITKKQF